MSFAMGDAKKGPIHERSACIPAPTARSALVFGIVFRGVYEGGEKGGVWEEGKGGSSIPDVQTHTQVAFPFCKMDGNNSLAHSGTHS